MLTQLLLFIILQLHDVRLRDSILLVLLYRMARCEKRTCLFFFTTHSIISTLLTITVSITRRKCVSHIVSSCPLSLTNSSLISTYSLSRMYGIICIRMLRNVRIVNASLCCSLSSALSLCVHDYLDFPSAGRTSRSTSSSLRVRSYRKDSSISEQSGSRDAKHFARTRIGH